jgi:hypothetical protein
MQITGLLAATLTLGTICFPTASHATTMQFDFTTVIGGGIVSADNVTGTFISEGIANGDTITGSFIYDTNTSLATGPDTDVPPGGNRGQYHFVGSPYGATISLDSGYTYTAESEVIVEVQNDFVLDATTFNEINGHIPQGTYDVLSIFAFLPNAGASGNSDVEWGINIVSDTSWFSGNTVIPDLPSTYNVYLQADEYDSVNNVLGSVKTSFDDSTSSVSAVPVPAAAWLFGSGLIGLIGVARHKKA